MKLSALFVDKRILSIVSYYELNRREETIDCPNEENICLEKSVLLDYLETEEKTNPRADKLINIFSHLDFYSLKIIVECLITHA